MYDFCQYENKHEEHNSSCRCREHTSVKYFQYCEKHTQAGVLQAIHTEIGSEMCTIAHHVTCACPTFKGTKCLKIGYRTRCTMYSERKRELHIRDCPELLVQYTIAARRGKGGDNTYQCSFRGVRQPHQSMDIHEHVVRCHPFRFVKMRRASCDAVALSCRAGFRNSQVSFAPKVLGDQRYRLGVPWRIPEEKQNIASMEIKEITTKQNQDGRVELTEASCEIKRLSEIDMLKARFSRIFSKMLNKIDDDACF